MSILLKFFSSLLFLDQSRVSLCDVFVLLLESFVDVFECVPQFVHRFYDLLVPDCF